MKTTLMITLMSLTLFVNAQEEKQYFFDHQMVYQMTYQPDSNNSNNIKKEYMELLTNDSISLFRAIKSGRMDSALNSELKKGNLLGPGVAFVMENLSTITYRIVKERIHNKIFTFDRPGNVKTAAYYVEPIDSLVWVISNDTATISGISCQRADLNFGNRKWIAWFAPEIAIQDGPYKFTGLPGLIIQISDQQKYWNFSMINLKNISKEVVVNFDKRRKPVLLTKAAFFKQLREYKDNGLAMDEASGLMTLNPDNAESTRRDWKANAAKNNNWIERYKLN